MSILVIAEHNNEQISSATLSVLSAAEKIGDDIHLLVAGHNIDNVTTAATQVTGVSKVLSADAQAYAHQLAENIAPLVVELGSDYTHIFAAASTSGKDLLPRVAALLDVGMVSDIIAIDTADTFKRPIYAGNAVATVKSNDTVKIATVRVSSFGVVEAQGGSAEVVTLSQDTDAGLSSFVSEDKEQSDLPELTDAKIVVSGGRGLQNGENFSLLYSLAEKLGAAVGASRAAVDAGYVPNDLQVGQTGKIVAPELYIAVGVSGAIQHLAGMKDSRVIVAINKDEDAPIFDIADYGLVADLFEAIPALEAAI